MRYASCVMTLASSSLTSQIDDIKNTRKISNVYLRGAAVDRAAIRARMVGKSE